MCPSLERSLAAMASRRRSHQWSRRSIGVPRPAVVDQVLVIFGGDADSAVQRARHCNEFLARIIQDDRQHFGGFATLPLPDAVAACRELEYALGVLGLDGVILFASHGALYLGDPDFEELSSSSSDDPRWCSSIRTQFPRAARFRDYRFPKEIV
jgi:hypothetical protein